MVGEDKGLFDPGKAREKESQKSHDLPVLESLPLTLSERVGALSSNHSEPEAPTGCSALASTYSLSSPCLMKFGLSTTTSPRTYQVPRS